MEGSAYEKTVDCWEIVHIPENPPICPDLQPTGIYVLGFSFFSGVFVRIISFALFARVLFLIHVQ